MAILGYEVFVLLLNMYIYMSGGLAILGYELPPPFFLFSFFDIRLEKIEEKGSYSSQL